MTVAKTVAIIGAGPVGLAAACHVLERGMKPVVLEAGDSVGSAVRQWRHVRLFSPWEYNVDRAAERLLRSTGWEFPSHHGYPTGGELIERYLEPLASRTPLKDAIRTSSRVAAIGRVGFDKVKTRGREAAQFEIRYENRQELKILHVDAVIDVSGTWSSPNPAGINGLPAIGENEHSARIAYGMPDVLGDSRDRYADRTVAVLGSGHSAIGTILDLADLKVHASNTQVIWLLRGYDQAKAFGGGANDRLAARGELGSLFAKLISDGKVGVESGFGVTHFSSSANKLRIGSDSGRCGRHLLVDELIVATGFRPDFGFVSELRMRLDPAIEAPLMLAPLIDPNQHSCGTVRPHGARQLAHDEPGFFIAGMKSYGRAPTFLMITGYEQVRSIVAHISGDHEAAARGELVLPETGVCTRAEVEIGNGPPAAAGDDICCTQVAIAKETAKASCGGR